MKNLVRITIGFCIFLFSCSHNNSDNEALSGGAFLVRDFVPIINMKNGKELWLDYTNTLKTGFIIPSSNQIKEGNFRFKFSIKNVSGKPDKFLYKIYYQNESYKFNETHEFDNENFYGSWDDSRVGFIETEIIPADENFHTVEGEFNITGNPRSEQRFFVNGRNDKWKRNPRVGEYSFLIVVTTKDNLIKIPEYIKYIYKKRDGIYINPYTYYLYKEGKSLLSTVVIKSDNALIVKAKPDLGAGVYINNYYLKSDYSKDYYSSQCGEDSILRDNAPFQQFIHYIDSSTKFFNIPVIEDVINGKYSKTDYNWNKAFFRNEELIGIIPGTTDRPCETVFSDAKNNKIVIKNPKSVFGKWQKQNVGVISRHGFTYGKFTIKTRMTELLNKHNVWNGITNTIWLICQSSAEGGNWNLRRNCNKEGYMATYWGGYEDKRTPESWYSEIDFEILKTSPYCPAYQFPPLFRIAHPEQFNVESWNTPMPEELQQYDDKVAVACTNWDMACPEPQNYGWGCNTVLHDNQSFEAHRWQKNYRAVTEKSMENDDEIFGGKYYYFQIEWKPEEIIWRIGPEKNQLKVIGYMNYTMTSIPNNQMVLIVTQEYHNTKWWPGSPYQQDNIPFLKNDLVGEIYEVTVE